MEVFENAIGENHDPLSREWGYILGTVISLLCGLFLAWIEEGFERSWMSPPHKFLPALSTAAMEAVLLLGSALYLRKRRAGLYLNAFSVAAMALIVICFLVSITEIAQGNNDSGEVFWVVVLPGIVCAVYSYVSFRKIRNYGLGLSAKAKCGGLSTTRRTVRLSVAPVEMTGSSDE